MHRIAFAIAAILGVFLTLPAMAQGEVVITQARALAGNVTPGDAPGFPVHLTVSGAYVLQSNLVVPANLVGINVTANNVDIDLNGFTISGGGVATTGIKSNASEGRIHDGVVNRFQAAGIYLRGSTWTIEDMKIVRNGGRGIDAVDARSITVDGSVLEFNLGMGIESGDDGVFRNSTFSTNGGEAIRCGEYCHVEGNSALRNVAGVWLRSGMVIGNTIAGNTSTGVLDRSGAVDTGIANNLLIDNNSMYGPQTSRVVTIHPNTCVGNPC